MAQNRPKPHHLRPAEPADAAAVAPIWHLGWRDGHIGFVPDQLLAARTPELFQERATARASDTTVLIVDGAVAGFVMVVEDEVEQVYLAAEHRGAGLADALLTEAERQVGDGGHQVAWLAVVAGNKRARAFYERQGWADEGPFEYAAQGPDGPIPVPCHRYTKTVNPGTTVTSAITATSAMTRASTTTDPVMTRASTTNGIDELAELDAAGRRISQLIRTADLATPVPHLDDWALRDLVDHLGKVHRWATAIVTARSMDVPRPGEEQLDGAALCDWFEEGLAQLLLVLQSSEGSDACPNFTGGSGGTVAWWVRRQLHETVVHRWDVERALASTTPIEPAVAADGVDEFLEVSFHRRGSQTLSGPLLLTTSEPQRSWTLTRTLTRAEQPDQVTVTRGRVGPSDAEIVGDPEAMLLLVWGRSGIDKSGLTVSGSREVAVSLIGKP